MLHGQLNRGRLDQIGGERSRGRAGVIGHQHRGIVARCFRILYAARNASAKKTGRSTCAATSFLDHRSPSASGKPAIKLKFWTAWPAAPLTRLSRALKIMSRPVRES